MAVKPPCAAPGKGGTIPVDDGVNLGTVKLHGNIDMARFESLLFQCGNGLCQGANLPLPVPLKVGEKKGHADMTRIISQLTTQTLVYIDCLVSQALDGTGLVFQAMRNGPMKDKEPPGEPRIMRSLLQAL
nr:unnamed protein product [Digitaria exilis]